MANRLTDTTIWKNQKWFKKLPAVYKLAWRYLTDVCDHAGVWKIDLPQLLDDIGEDEFDFPDFLLRCNSDLDKKTGKAITRQRVFRFDDDHIWLTGFMTFQYGGKTHIIDPGNLSIVGAKKILESLNLWELGIEMGYFQIKCRSPLKPLEAPSPDLPETGSPLKPLEATENKDKEKDKVKERTDSDLGNTESVSNSGEMENLDATKISPKMVTIFKETYPKYPVDVGPDMTACIKIAYRITRLNGWTKESATNGKMDDVLSEWRKLVEFSKNDKWFSTRCITDFEKEFQRLIQSSNSKNGQHQQASSQGSGFIPD